MSVNRKKILLNSVANSDFFLSDLFTKLDLPVEGVEGRNVLTYSFEGLKRPVFVDGIHFQDLGKNVKIVYVNEFNEKVILFESGETLFLNLLGSEKAFLDLGYFMVGSKDKIVIDFVSESAVNKTLTLSLGLKYGIFPHYKLHKVSVLGAGQEVTLMKNNVDYIGYHSADESVIDLLTLNTMKVKNLDLGSSYPNFVKLFDSTYSVPFDSFKVALEGSASSGVVLHSEKVVYNRDCIAGQVEILRNFRSDAVYRVKNDFTTELYKGFGGENVDPDKIQFLIEGYSSLVFVDKYKGHYDSYELVEVLDTPTESES